MATVSSRLVVRSFAGFRVAIGITFAPAPKRLSQRSDILLTRSFAVRETVLGLGGLFATSSPEVDSSTLRMWAALGALTDGGDLAAALAGLRRRDSSARVPAFMAGAGLVAELGALSAASRVSPSSWRRRWSRG